MFFHPSIAAGKNHSHSHNNINISVFEIWNRNNKTSLLFYAYEVIHLINEGVTSPHVQE